MILKASFLTCFAALCGISSAVSLMEKVIHSTHGSSYQMINHNLGSSVPYNRNKQSDRMPPNKYPHEGPHFTEAGEMDVVAKDMKPVPENLYTLAIPKMNFGRPKEYYMPKAEEIPSTIRYYENPQNNYQIDYSRSAKPHLMQKQYENTDTINYKVEDEQYATMKPPMPTYPDYRKNNYMLASDVSHVKFNGMGTSYEF